METFKFKTNIKCGGCIAAVMPALNGLEGIKRWEVDNNDPDKILTVDANSVTTANDIIEALKTKGYDAKKV